MDVDQSGRAWSNKPGTIAPLSLASLRAAYTELTARHDFKPEIRIISVAEADHYRIHGCNDWFCWMRTSMGLTELEFEVVMHDVMDELL